MEIIDGNREPSFKISKPKEDQILLEGNIFKGFEIECKTDNGIADSKFNSQYEGFMMIYRTPGMTASKQMFFGDTVSLMTLLSSSMESLMRSEVCTEKDFKEMVKMAAKYSKVKK